MLDPPKSFLGRFCLAYAEPMGGLKRFVMTAAAAAVAVGSVQMAGVGAIAAADGTVTAGQGAAKIAPFSTTHRRCDATNDTFVEGGGDGTGFAAISRSGNKVRADITLENATPDTTYGVRLILMPRSPADSCGPGAPGVAVAYPTTNSGGNTYLTVEQDVLPGATGAWVFIDGPLSGPKPYGEYYTSDFVAQI
jgi:hypothetical protein